MKEYNPIQFLAYLVELCNDKTLQLNVRKFNEELDKIHNSLWNQHFHIGFGFEEFALVCKRTFPNNCQLDIEKLTLAINKDKEFERELNNYIKIYENPEF